MIPASIRNNNPGAAKPPSEVQADLRKFCRDCGP